MKKSQPSISVRQSLRTFGADIKTARLKRRLTMALVAERAEIGLSTLGKIQKGDPDVSLGNYASVLFALGIGTPFTELLNPASDATGLLLDAERLPKRVHGPRTRRNASHSESEQV
ncbi:MAG: helix-turn-helix domain-containing protein [Deltaproteobacteria bacterium]|jgi:transcriptional regulator with XRE-family HTH domain|nr:helix-turn-helix domain-containing protein [Deltaproteobacteria bacterium]